MPIPARYTSMPSGSIDLIFGSQRLRTRLAFVHMGFRLGSLVEERIPVPQLLAKVFLQGHRVNTRGQRLFLKLFILILVGRRTVSGGQAGRSRTGPFDSCPPPSGPLEVNSELALASRLPNSEDEILLCAKDVVSGVGSPPSSLILRDMSRDGDQPVVPKRAATASPFPLLQGLCGSDPVSSKDPAVCESQCDRGGQLKLALGGAAEEVTEVEATGGQDGPVGFESPAWLDGDIAVVSQQALLIKGAQNCGSKVWDLHVEQLGHVGHRGREEGGVSDIHCRLRH
ncbi:hypothetical protein EYF80_006550 [Liparis tanakae]|uniref:Uncharacterized protein n=1 Tax=Liparis tanakae TaxID=230148 RepID=A0A4Z2IZP1_9TELE|nr:hypothetical protein EYF80_006550 [Liparis tanakae]